MHIIIVAGARPNFIKIAPIIRQLIKVNIPFSIVHTGQHYNESLNDVFFEELNIPNPTINLEAGSGSPSQQTGLIMLRFEEYLKTNDAPIVMVVGDVNSTMACGIVAKKMGRQLIHIEGGIRSFDTTMPEEINRLVTDAITDHFFTTSTFANENLIKAGVDQNNIHFVGNTMIDTLEANKNKFLKPDFFNEYNLKEKNYWVLTLHRPSNVDSYNTLVQILAEITLNNSNKPIIFPVHPRIPHKIREALTMKFPTIRFIEPQSYLSFMYLISHAIGVITDSGGIQEETTVLNIPCLTIRKNTERPETIDSGTNKLIPDITLLAEAMNEILIGKWKTGTIPEKWDGEASKRIVETLQRLYIEN